MNGLIPPRAWIRPLLMLVSGLALAALLFAIDQTIAAVAMVALAVLMGYWTSPIRRGEHTAFDEAMLARSPEHAVILWAPGNPPSARMQVALRRQRTDVTWVNVFQDAQARAYAEAHGGLGELPIVLVGEQEPIHQGTVGAFLDAMPAAHGEPTDGPAESGRAAG